LANLGDIVSGNRRLDPFGDHGGPFDFASGLCDGSAILGLSNVASAGAWHAGGESDTARLGACSNLLAGLLRPLMGAKAVALSRTLLAEFVTLPDVLAADPLRLRTVAKSETVARFIVLVRDAMVYSLRLRIGDFPILSSNERLIDYLHASMAYCPTEQFRVLFLNARNMLIRDEVMSVGSVLEAPVFPREVFRRALEVGATGVVLVHNHPSGNLDPSEADLNVTRRIASCGHALDIALHDHLIVTRNGFTSLKSRGLI
jgi:DNA repair protein RadC